MNTQQTTTGRRTIAGWVISGILILLLLADAVGKLLKPQPVIQSTLELGYPERTITGLGVVLLICTVLYAIPRFSVIGAVLLTGYLGGTVATHVRVGHPLFSHVLVPVYVCIFVWMGLSLRNHSLQNLLTNN